MRVGCGAAALFGLLAVGCDEVAVTRALPAGGFVALRGRFVRDETLEAALRPGDWTPLPGGNRDATSALAADLDGDGRDELVLNATIEMASPSRDRGRSWIARRSAGGVWRVEPLPEAMGMCRTTADLDADGDIDLVCAGRVARVFWNERGAFDPSRATVLRANGAAMSVLARDLDEDGLADLVVGNWDNTPMEVHHNLGAGRFEEVAAAWGLGLTERTWFVAAVDLDGDGREDLYVGGDGDGHQNYGLRALGPGPDGGPRFARVRPARDPRTAEAWFGTTNAGPMGSALGWIDGDDRPDLVLASSLWKGPGVPILTAREAGDWRMVSDSFGMSAYATSAGGPMNPWSPRVWDIDHDGRPEVLVPCGDDVGHAGFGVRGDSRVVLYRFDRDGALTDVAPDVLPTAGQYMTPSLVDLDGDDDLDLVLGRFGEAWQVYRNDVAPAGPHGLLRLVGRASNPDALGARVTVRVGAALRRYVVGDVAAPQATEHAPIDVALGEAGRIDELTVRWPSGYTQVLRGVPRSSRVGVVEPELVTVEPASRHAPADGAATVTVTVRPVDASGAPREGEVRIRAPFHPDAGWTGPEERLADGRVRRALRAPTRGGSVVVEVSVDGAALAVRPRVWFDATP